MQTHKHKITRIRQRRKAFRPGEIVAVASRLFAKKGYASTRISDVAMQCGIAKGTTFRYFASKEALFSAALAFEAGEMSQRHQSLIEIVRPAQVDSVLRVILADWFGALSNGSLGRAPMIVATEGASYPGLAKAFREVVATGLRANLQTLLSIGVHAGIFRQVDVHSVVENLIGLLLVRSFAQHAKGCDLGAPELTPHFAESALDLILAGLKCRETAARNRNRKGRS